jgi:hypothetical protein
VPEQQIATRMNSDLIELTVLLHDTPHPLEAG